MAVVSSPYIMVMTAHHISCYVITGIDFDEFLDLYRRLFISCRSVVSHDVSDLVPVTTPRSPSPRQSKIPIKVSERGLSRLVQHIY